MASGATLKLGSKSEVFQVQGHSWNCTTGLPSDVVVEVGEASFHLHKFPLLSRSGVMGRMIRESSSEFGTVAPCVLQFHDLPGGAKSFELITKFCYDVKMELDAVNVVTVRCAAEQLEMTEEYGEGNLVRLSESFLTDLLGNWRDSINLLEACTDDVRSQAEELHIVSRCIHSLATKAHGDPKRGVGVESAAPDQFDPLKTIAESGKDTWNGISGTELKPNPQASAEEDESWWYEDVSSLCLPMYKRFIAAAESTGIRPGLVAGSILFYAQRHLPELNRHLACVSADSTTTSTNEAAAIPTLRDLQLAAAPTSEVEQRALLEEMVTLLPAMKGVVQTKLLLGLYRFAAALRASSPCKEDLERRVGAQLDDAALEDLLIPNWNHDAETLFDVDCVQRMLDHFMLLQDPLAAAKGLGCSEVSGEVKLMVDPPVATDDSVTVSPVSTVAKIIDDYLVEVAPDVNLRFHRFQSLAAAIPNYARTQEDGLYRAIDTYLKAHPRLTDMEREHLCRLINCQKLSLEACTHAAQNERLPFRVVVQVLFFEQLRLRSSMAAWFLVSENVVPNPGSRLRRSYDAATTTTMSYAGAASSTTDPADGAPSRELITEEVGEASHQEAGAPDADGMNLRMTELEKECSIMKVEIERILKPKRTKVSRDTLPKKLGFKMIWRPLCEGKMVPISCLRDGKKSLFW